MEVIRETKTIAPKQIWNQQLNSSTIELKRILDLQNQGMDFVKLKEPKQNMVPETILPVPDDSDFITKRNAAMILIGYIAQKRQLILASGIASIGILAGFYLAGDIGGFIPLAGYIIYAGNTFLNNEKELKELKKRFEI